MFCYNIFMNYTYRVIIEPDGKHFHAYAPALKGCHTSGKTIAEAKKNIREAIALYLAPYPKALKTTKSHQVLTLAV